MVFQHCGAQCVNFDLQNKATAGKGRKDAQAAVRLAEELGQPAETPIYFAIDFDPTPGRDNPLPAARIWASIDAYFDQVGHVFARTRWQVGVYGAGITCQRLKASGKAKYFWLSSSLGHLGSPDFFNGGQWHLFQNVIEIKRSYARNTFDTDVVNPAAPYFGQWTSRGPAMPHDAAAAEEILASRSFVKKACVMAAAPDNGKPRPAPKTARYNSTCRILTDEDRGYVGVSMTEDDAVDGYVHTSDLVLGDWLETCRGLARRIVASRRRPRLRPSRAQPAWEFPRYASVYADGFELVRHRVGDGGFTAVGHQDRRAVSGMQREQMHSRLQLGRLRIKLVHVFGTDRLDVGDLSAAENSKCLLVHCHFFFRFASGSLTHGPRLLSGLSVESELQFNCLPVIPVPRSGSS